MLTSGSPFGQLLLLCPTASLIIITISQAAIVQHLYKLTTSNNLIVTGGNELMTDARDPYPHRRRPAAAAATAEVNLSCRQVEDRQWSVEVVDEAVDKDKGRVMSSQNDEYCLDLERIRNCVCKLEIGGWYYGKLSWQEATALLKKTAVGTFLMRDSSDPAYLFALSVQTERGPTSVRIHYLDGQFKLDAEDMIAGHMPLFDCAVKLVDYYVRLSGTDKARCHVWLDESGRRDRSIYLERPLLHRLPTLKHVCRLTFNANPRLHNWIMVDADVTLPTSVRTYLNEYPYLR